MAVAEKKAIIAKAAIAKQVAATEMKEIIAKAAIAKQMAAAEKRASIAKATRAKQVIAALKAAATKAASTKVEATKVAATKTARIVKALQGAQVCLTRSHYLHKRVILYLRPLFTQSGPYHIFACYLHRVGHTVFRPVIYTEWAILYLGPLFI